MYEKYFTNIVKTINDQVQKKWPALTPGRDAKSCVSTGDGVFAWAETHEPELFYQEHKLDLELNESWNTSPQSSPEAAKSEFDIFKAKVLAWGRVVLIIYKKFTETSGREI